MADIPGVVPIIQDVEESMESKHLEMAISEVYSKKNIELKTDLNTGLIRALTKGKLFYKQYKVKLVDDLVKTIMELNVSKNREGRKEFTKIVQSMNSYPDMQDVKPRVSERLFKGGV